MGMAKYMDDMLQHCGGVVCHDTEQPLLVLQQRLAHIKRLDPTHNPHPPILCRPPKTSTCLN